jgi:hypothetical protein
MFRDEFLGLSETYLVIINVNLNEDQTQKLLHELRKHRKAIGHHWRPKGYKSLNLLCNDYFSTVMIGIFSDLIEKSMKVLMDDFFIYGTTFDECLSNLTMVLQRCKEVNLVLN